MGRIGFGRMRGRMARRVALSITTILAGGLAAPALAQSPHPNVDANGVDLTTGRFEFELPVATVGSGQAALPLVAYDGQLDNWSNVWLYQTYSSGTTYYQVVTGKRSDNFTSASSASTRGTGATLTASGSDMLYRTLDGVTILFTNPAPVFGGASNLCDVNNNNLCFLLPQTVGGMSGLDVDYTWTIDSDCEDVPIESETGPDCHHSWRLASVNNSAGYSINWSYGGSPWDRRTGATLKNGGTTVGTIGYGNPSAGVYTITAPGGGVWRITGSYPLISAVRRPSAGSDTTTVSYSGTSVTSLTRDGVTTGYARSLSGSTATMVVTDALSNTTTIVSDMNKYRTTSVTDALSRTTSMTYDSPGKLTEVTWPEGDKVQYTYDGRGNVTEVRRKASGSGLSDIVTSASYPGSCSTPACNFPDSTTDALGNVTDYTYDGTTGLITSVTLPSAGGGANRAQTRYSYTTNGAGVALLTGVSQCRTGTVALSCVGTADEVKQAIAYDSNLNITSLTVAAGDNSLSAVTTATYTSAGDVLTVDGPLSGSGDTTTFRYDADRRRVGVTSADPDGGGALKRRAVKTTYNADGQPTVVELGNVNGTSDGDWASFASAQQLTSTYDSNGFKTKDVLTASSTTYQVTQYGYDGVGRLQCTALRMNSATWGSLPGSACSLGTAGSYGDDRIARTTYDAAGQATKVQSGYATGIQADDVTTTYTNNGRVATVTDAEGNKTTYAYDGHDRLSKTSFPNTTKGAGTSSSTDYEELLYDARSQITVRRLRGYAGDSSKHIDYSYDNLGRVIAKDLPNSEPDVSYTYNLLGEMTGASQTGAALTFGYDALGRNTSQGGPQGTVSYQYDAAGRRTRLTWPDSFYVTYDYLVTGDMTAIRENDAGSGYGVLATFGYDDLGRRTSLSRGNGTTTSYAYDNVSRLASLSQDLAGSGDDVTTSYTYGPAGQIATSTKTNDSYAWTGHVNVARGYTTNGLNQHTVSGGVSLGYDARGNLNASGATSYGYSSENLLTSGPGVTLSYDPLLRLRQTAAAATYTQQYDGAEMIAEYNTGTLIQRYVHGPGTDEPLVNYIANGARYWLYADERGSIVRAAGDNGAAVASFKYDEYGIPQASTTARFQYTGQAWIDELGMYYYKARMYSPSLGRFMQTDPIGYGDGSNMYAYVGNDPVNGRDPTGLLADGCVQVTGSHIPNCDGRDIATKYVLDTYSGLTASERAAAIDAIGAYIVGYNSLGSTISSLIQNRAIVPCNGTWNCGDIPFDSVAEPGNQLNNNSNFRYWAAKAWGIAIDRGVEVGFGGVGFSDFQTRTIAGATSPLVISKYYDRIEADIIAAIAKTGATVFFHTHQYMDGHPGFSKHDQQMCSGYNFYCVVYAGPKGRGGDYGWYYYHNDMAAKIW